MKTLSLHQPRAEQVIRGEKTVDLRSWTVSYRGPLAIHAPAERRDARCRELGFDPATLAYGAVLGWVELVDITPLDTAAYEALRPEHRSDEPFPGAPCYAWRFAHPRRLPQPLPCPGRRRLFEVGWEEGREGERGEQIYYRAVPPPEPDPPRPFALYALPEKGGGYRVALYQWLVARSEVRSEVCSQARSEAECRSGDGTSLRCVPDYKPDYKPVWSIELGGPALQAVADHLLAALRANGHKATDLARTPETPFLLDEPTGLRLALLFLAIKPLARLGRIAALGQGIQAMSDEEAYYWFSKCTAGPAAARAQRALRVLLAEE
jgi:hypothetical protein